MNEPKKRGRPSRAEIAAREMTAEAVAAGKAANAGHPVYRVVGRRTDMQDMARAYALRVWHGQSVSLPRAERIRRCEAALQGQNLPTEGVEYPE